MNLSHTHTQRIETFLHDSSIGFRRNALFSMIFFVLPARIDFDERVCVCVWCSIVGGKDKTLDIEGDGEGRRGGEGHYMTKRWTHWGEGTRHEDVSG